MQNCSENYYNHVIYREFSILKLRIMYRWFIVSVFWSSNKNNKISVIKKYSHILLYDGAISEKCVTRWFRCYANIVECIYTDLDGTAHSTGYRLDGTSLSYTWSNVDQKVVMKYMTIYVSLEIEFRKCTREF